MCDAQLASLRSLVVRISEVRHQLYTITLCYIVIAAALVDLFIVVLCCNVGIYILYCSVMFLSIISCYIK